MWVQLPHAFSCDAPGLPTSPPNVGVGVLRGAPPETPSPSFRGQQVEIAQEEEPKAREEASRGAEAGSAWLSRATVRTLVYSSPPSSPVSSCDICQTPALPPERHSEDRRVWSAWRSWVGRMNHICVAAALRWEGFWRAPPEHPGDSGGSGAYLPMTHSSPLSPGFPSLRRTNPGQLSPGHGPEPPLPGCEESRPLAGNLQNSSCPRAAGWSAAARSTSFGSQGLLVFWALGLFQREKNQLLFCNFVLSPKARCFGKWTDSAFG